MAKKTKQKRDEEFTFVTILPDGEEVRENDEETFRWLLLRAEYTARVLPVPADFPPMPRQTMPSQQITAQAA